MHPSEYKNMFDKEQSYWWYVGLHSLVYSYLCKQKINKEVTILDAGCGTGGLIHFLSQKGYQNLEGFDYSTDAINFCQQRGFKNCFQQDLNTWSPNKKYDVIISCDVLYHKDIIDDEKIIQKFKEALYPGGLLILNLPAFELLKRKHDIIVETKKRYTINAIKKLTQSSNLSTLHISYRLPILFIAILISKFLNSIFKRTEKSDLDSIAPFINKTLINVNLLENSLLKNKIKLPFGSSVFAILKNNNTLL